MPRPGGSAIQRTPRSSVVSAGESVPGVSTPTTISRRRGPSSGEQRVDQPVELGDAAARDDPGADAGRLGHHDRFFPSSAAAVSKTPK